LLLPVFTEGRKAQEGESASAFAWASSMASISHGTHVLHGHKLRMF
jgi:hypothetical protein